MPLPKVPQAVADRIKLWHEYHKSLMDIFGVLSSYGITRTEPSSAANVWIINHADEFAVAWMAWPNAEIEEAKDD